MKTSGKLIIVCGLPGSGKTTFARKLEREADAIRFSPDEWMESLSLDLWDEARRNKVEALQWELGRRLLSGGLTVILEWGTWTRAERDVLMIQARAIGAAVELYHLTASKETLLQRVHKRGRENPPITEADLASWAEQFQVPNLEEMKLFDHSALIQTD